MLALAATFVALLAATAASEGTTARAAPALVFSAPPLRIGEGAASAVAAGRRLLKKKPPSSNGGGDVSATVVGGTDAAEGRFPYQTYVLTGNAAAGWALNCGGSIIRTDAVLTAAQ